MAGHARVSFQERVLPPSDKDDDVSSTGEAGDAEGAQEREMHRVDTDAKEEQHGGTCEEGA